MEKETQLDSEISIKEKFKALSPKEKYSYICEYYTRKSQLFSNI